MLNLSGSAYRHHHVWLLINTVYMSVMKMAVSVSIVMEVCMCIFIVILECIRSFVTCTESTTVDDVVRVDSDDDGHYMYAYTASARLLGWDIDSNLCIIQRRQPLIDPSIAIAHDNDVYAATYDGHLRVCRASSGQCIMSFKCGKRVTCMEVCENDLVFVGTEAGEVLLYHGSCPTPVRTYNAQDAIRCLYYKDGLIFGGSDDGLVHVWYVV